MEKQTVTHNKTFFLNSSELRSHAVLASLQNHHVSNHARLRNNRQEHSKSAYELLLLYHCVI